MTRIILALLCLTGTLTLSCDSSTDPAGSIPFSLTIEVTDPSGSPIEGLRISSWNDIKGYQPFASTLSKSPAHSMAATGIPFTVPIKSVVDLSITDFNNNFVATLNDTVLPTGAFIVAWAPDASVPPGIYKCRMVASDTLTGQTLFDETIYPVKHEFDPARAVMGFTDNKGEFKTINPLLFPYALADKPELLFISFDGDTVGTLEYDNAATVVVTDTSTGQKQIQTIALSKMSNRAAITWDPGARDGVSAASPGAAMRPSLVVGADVPRPPLTWRLGPNYPNPFN